MVVLYIFSCQSLLFTHVGQYHYKVPLVSSSESLSHHENGAE